MPQAVTPVTQRTDSDKSILGVWYPKVAWYTALRRITYEPCFEGDAHARGDAGEPHWGRPALLGATIWYLIVPTDDAGTASRNGVTPAHLAATAGHAVSVQAAIC